ADRWARRSSVVEAVGTQESFMQAVGATRLPDLVQLICDRKIDPGKVFDLTLPLEQVAEGYKAMDERRATKVMLTL
ncbi:MAG TPA: hypothetical protein VFY84_03955, partial [Jiangellales bacterium]|nr:hypothetical protein [Jiangellales bacterium]